MEPWQSWGLALVVGGGLAYYYSQDKEPKNRTGRSLSISELQQPIKQATTTAKRRQDKPAAREKPVAAKVADTANGAAAKLSEVASSAVSTAQQAVAKKNKKGGKSSDTTSSRKSVPAVAEQSKPKVEETADDDMAEDMDNKEWAKQLLARKQGISLSAPSANSKAVRTVKASSRDQYNDNAGTASAGDVSDMLEPVAAGPSAIRITGEQKAKKQPVARPDTSQETKKQRQNRQKNEEARIGREEAERARQVLLEQQRKTAREARGEPAKNGLASAAAPSSVWTPGNQPNTQAMRNGVVQPLLDTFDHDATSTSSSNDAATNITTPATVASATADIPSEEAQLEMLSEMDGWAEVSTKKAKKKTQVSDTLASEPAPIEEVKEKKTSAYNAAPTSELLKSGNSTKSAASKPASSSNGYAALEERIKNHPEDDEWYVDLEEPRNMQG